MPCRSLNGWNCKPLVEAASTGAASTISWFSECRIWIRTDVQQTRVIALVMITVRPESARSGLTGHSSERLLSIRSGPLMLWNEQQ